MNTRIGKSLETNLQAASLRAGGFGPGRYRVGGLHRAKAGVSRLCALCLFLLFGLNSCGSVHPWGTYDEAVLHACNNFAETDLGQDLEELGEALVYLDDNDRLPPPGLHAHIGYLHSLTGDNDSARVHFQAEMDLYPEARVFMELCLSKLGGGP